MLNYGLNFSTMPECNHNVSVWIYTFHEKEHHRKDRNPSPPLPHSTSLHSIALNTLLLTQFISSIEARLLL